MKVIEITQRFFGLEGENPKDKNLREKNYTLRTSRETGAIKDD